MKKILTLSFLILCICFTTAGAQRGVSVTPDAVDDGGAVEYVDIGGKKCDPLVMKTGCLAKKAPVTDITLEVRLQNPLKVKDIKEAIAWFVNVLLKIAVPFIVVFFIWSGFRFIAARGNPTAIGEAKKMFWWTVIGTLLILGAWTITNAIIGTVNSIAN